MNPFRFDFSDAEAAAFLAEQESQYLEPPATFADAIHQEVSDTANRHGDVMPWTKTHELFQFRPGAVSVWAGYSGHMKSLVTGMAGLWWLPSTGVTIASLEMPPEVTLARMVRQAAGANQPTRRYIDAWVKKLQGKLWVYDQLDKVPFDRVLAMTHYAAMKLGSKHVIIDSLVKLGLGRDDYGAQEDAMNRLQLAAKRHRIHVHLVHHMRKGEDEAKRPGKFDLRGAGEIGDLADNIIVPHRNIAKLRKQRAGQDYDDEQPDFTLSVPKQRGGIDPLLFNLWFNESNMQFCSSNARRTMLWPGDEDDRNQEQAGKTNHGAASGGNRSALSLVADNDEPDVWADGDSF